MTDTQTRIAKIKERLGKATPGPWGKDELGYESYGPPTERSFNAWVHCSSIWATDEYDTVCDLSYDGSGFGDEKRIRGNMDFISNAPSDIAWLLDQVEQLRLTNESYRAKLLDFCAVAERRMSSDDVCGRPFDEDLSDALVDAREAIKGDEHA